MESKRVDEMREKANAEEAIYANPQNDTGSREAAAAAARAYRDGLVVIDAQANQVRDLLRERDECKRSAEVAEGRLGVMAEALRKYTRQPKAIPDEPSPESVEIFEDWAKYREGSGLAGWASDLRRWCNDWMALNSALAERDDVAKRLEKSEYKRRCQRIQLRRFQQLHKVSTNNALATAVAVRDRDAESHRAEVAESQLAEIDMIARNEIAALRKWASYLVSRWALASPLRARAEEVHAPEYSTALTEAADAIELGPPEPPHPEKE